MTMELCVPTVTAGGTEDALGTMPSVRMPFQHLLASNSAPRTDEYLRN